MNYKKGRRKQKRPKKKKLPKGEKKFRERLREKQRKNDGAIRCHYCNIPEEDFIPIWKKFYKRRGKRLEIDRKDPRKGYTENNCVLACAICNCAKSDKFNADEFKKVGKVIQSIWEERKKLKKMKKSGKEPKEEKGS